MKKAESEIKTLFDEYNDKLSMRKKDVYDQLVKWGNTLISRIEDHVKTQRKFLDEHFDSQKRFFEVERKRIIAEAVAHDKNKETEQVKRLLAEWKALKLNLPVLDRYEVLTSYMSISTEEKLALKQSEENKANQTRENQSHNRSVEGNNNSTGNRGSGSARRKPIPNPPSSTDKSPSTRLVETQTSVDHDSSPNDGRSSKSGLESGDGVIDKCPVCYMIFPKTMTKDDQRVHINEHYPD